MRKYLLILLVLVLSITRVYAADATPVGYWKTIDDVTGHVKSIIQITEGSDHRLSGRLVKTYPEPGEAPHLRCEKCTDDKKDQLILGMVILTGLKQEKDEWVDGKILDPLNGKYYSCTARVMDNGTKLNVHGYIGLQLFGRTQTWVRAKHS